MNISEIVALAGVVLSMGTNIGLYIHLSSVMNIQTDVGAHTQHHPGESDYFTDVHVFFRNSSALIRR